MAVGRATLRAGGQADGRQRLLVVSAPWAGTLLGQAADADVVAGHAVRPGRPLARGLPAAFAAGRAGHAVVRGGSWPAPVDTAGRAVCRLGAAVRAALHLPGEEGTDRPAAGAVHHAGQLRPAAPPAAGPCLALVVAGLVLCRHRGDHQGWGHAGPADDRTGRPGSGPALATRTPACR
ncbi:hypothetical protein G6F31_013330 [Rhizopus arrhizus]|nr:hypothetical protein G6F31_013330 [Rhizopus arrhizus]